MSRHGFLLFAALAVGAALTIAMSRTARETVFDFTRRGRRLSRSRFDELEAVILETPETLRAQAERTLGVPVPQDEYSLARMVRSEEGGASAAVKALIVWVALNDADALGWSPTELVTYSTKRIRKGRYGTQVSRRYSTRQDPYEVDLAVVRSVLADRQAGKPDPTGGATKFLRRALLGEAAYAEVAANWGREGLRPATVPPAPRDLVFFRREA